MGHLISALWVWATAHKIGADVILRLEDHDQQRSRRNFEESIQITLARLGFSWNNSLHEQSLFIQRNRQVRYQEIFELLKQQNLIYSCRCTRSQLQSFRRGDSGEVIYPSICQNNPFQPEDTLRLHVPQDLIITWHEHILGMHSRKVYDEAGDFSIRDRHGNWTYQFCCAIDDLDQDIQWVVRGQDLFYSTSRQLYLRQLIAPKSPPPIFFHHPLVCDATGRKLSKSAQDQSLSSLLAQGISPAQLLYQALSLMNCTSPRDLSLDQALEIIGKHPLILEIS